MSDPKAVLEFIEAIEKKSSNKSIYEIANQLRGYTKPSYTTSMWTVATGYKQLYIDNELKGKLNQDLIISGEMIDFGHFIAALSDQINQSGFRFSDFTKWTGDHTSWAGDVGSSIVTYRAQPNPPKLPTLTDVLNRFAGDADYTADVSAYVVGSILNNRQHSIAQAIAQYDAIPYAQHVRSFLSDRFGGIIEENQLKNPAKVEAQIRKSIFTYLEFSSGYGVLKSIKSKFSQKPKLAAESRNNSDDAAQLLESSLHFLRHLIQKGNLQSTQFNLYQSPQTALLGTTNYSVEV